MYAAKKRTVCDEERVRLCLPIRSDYTAVFVIASRAGDAFLMHGRLCSRIEGAFKLGFDYLARLSIMLKVDVEDFVVFYPTSRGRKKSNLSYIYDYILYGVGKHDLSCFRW